MLPCRKYSTGYRLEYSQITVFFTASSKKMLSCKLFDPFYKTIKDILIHYILLLISITIVAFNTEKLQPFLANLLFWGLFQSMICSCFVECNGISIIYCGILGFGLYQDGNRSRFVYLSIFVIANILSWPYISEDILTLVAHFAALICGFALAKLTNVKEQAHPKSEQLLAEEEDSSEED
jgi:hypothetical protein